MVEINIRVNTAGFRRALRKTPERLARETQRALDQHAFIFEGFAKSTLFKGRPGIQGRTGALARSIVHVSNKSPKRLADVSTRVFIGSRTVPYARIQERGGIVKPVRAKYLTIPLPANLTAGGVPRYKSARELFDQRGEDVEIFRSKRGNLIIALREGGSINFEGDLATGKTGGKLKPLWVLKKQVKIPARLGFVDAFRSREMREDRIKRLNKAIERALTPLSGGAA